MAVANTLAYYYMTTIAAITSFIVQALGFFANEIRLLKPVSAPLETLDLNIDLNIIRLNFALKVKIVKKSNYSNRFNYFNLTEHSLHSTRVSCCLTRKLRTHE